MGNGFGKKGIAFGAVGIGCWLLRTTVYDHLGMTGEVEGCRKWLGLVPRTECDSEVLRLLLARFPGSILQRARQTASFATGGLALLGIWRNPTRLLVVRDGKPLHFCETRHGFYFTSLPDELPGTIQAINHGYAGVLTWGRTGLQLVGTALDRPQGA